MRQVTGSRVAFPIAIVIVFALLLSSVTGCSILSTSRDAQVESSSGEAPVATSEPPQTDLGDSAPYNASVAKTRGTSVEEQALLSPSSRGPIQDQLLIRTATMRLRVEDIEKTLQRIRNTTSAFKGQIDDLQVSTENEGPVYRPMAEGTASQEVVPLSAYVTVRVPSNRLAEFTKRVSAFGKVLRESANQTDVTQQHIDLAARLKNLRAEEARLRDFLEEAKNVKEMLLVETELSRVRGEIEALQSELDYMDRQISHGTLTIELVKPAPVVRPTGTDWGFAQAITDGIRGAAGAVRSIIAITIALSPFIAIGLVVFLVVRWLVRRRRYRSADAGAAAMTGMHASDSTADDAKEPAEKDDPA